MRGRSLLDAKCATIQYTLFCLNLKMEHTGLLNRERRHHECAADDHQRCIDPVLKVPDTGQPRLWNLYLGHIFSARNRRTDSFANGLSSGV